MLGLQRPSVSEIEAGNRAVATEELSKLDAGKVQRGRAQRASIAAEKQAEKERLNRRPSPTKLPGETVVER